MNRRKRTSRFSDNQNLNQVEKIEVQLFKRINDIEFIVELKKLIRVNPILLPLVMDLATKNVAPCATNANAHVLALVLIQEDVISFMQGKGHYSQKQLASFKDRPETLLKDLNISSIDGSIDGSDLNDFDFKTVNVNYKLSEQTIRFQIQISNKKDQSDVATTKIITLHFTNAY